MPPPTAAPPRLAPRLTALACLALWTAALAAGPALKITVFDPGPSSYIAESRLAAAYARLGQAVEFVEMPGERALQSTLTGATDGELIRVAELEGQYPQLVRVPVPVSEARFAVFARPGVAPPLAQGWEALRPYAFAYARGTRLIARRVDGMPGTRRVESVSQAFAMLIARRIDLVIADRADGEASLRRLGLEHRIVALEPALEVAPLYHYLHRRHAALVPALSAALRQPAAP